MKFEWPMWVAAMRLLLPLWEPTPVGDGLQGVFHAHRPQGGLLQKAFPCVLFKIPRGLSLASLQRPANMRERIRQNCY